MSYHLRQKILKGAVLNQCRIIFSSFSLETSGTPCAVNHLSQVPKPICSLEADLSSVEIVAFLHILLMGRSVLLRGTQNIKGYFLFWKNSQEQGGAEDESFSWFGWQIFFFSFTFWAWLTNVFILVFLKYHWAKLHIVVFF